MWTTTFLSVPFAFATTCSSFILSLAQYGSEERLSSSIAGALPVRLTAPLTEPLPPAGAAAAVGAAAGAPGAAGAAAGAAGAAGAAAGAAGAAGASVFFSSQPVARSAPAND